MAASSSEIPLEKTGRKKQSSFFFPTIFSSLVTVFFKINSFFLYLSNGYVPSFTRACFFKLRKRFREIKNLLLRASAHYLIQSFLYIVLAFPSSYAFDYSNAYFCVEPTELAYASSFGTKFAR